MNVFETNEIDPFMFVFLSMAKYKILSTNLNIKRILGLDYCFSYFREDNNCNLWLVSRTGIHLALTTPSHITGSRIPKLTVLLNSFLNAMIKIIKCLVWEAIKRSLV